MNEFLHKLRIFNKNIRTNKLSMQYWLEEQAQFISTLKKLTKLPDNVTDNEHFIKAYANYYKSNNKLPKVRVQLMKYQKTLNDEYYRDKLEKSLDNIDPELKITSYDEEVFKFDNMLDEYINKLSAMPLELGYVSVDTKTYTWKTESIVKSAEKYYKNMFGVSMAHVNTIVQEYIRGLVWVFDYYYNDNPDANIWFYKYNNSPLLTQIYKYLIEINDLNHLTKLQSSLSKYKVSINIFFNEEEHFMYVSPLMSFPNMIPEKYKNMKFKYIDVKKIAHSTLTTPNPTDIDCRGVTFLNKCHITELHETDVDTSYKADIEFLKKLRG
jgi:5'-3' exonuclease